MTGHCSVCGQDLPATRPAEPYEDLARIIEHQHKNPDFGRCIGSRMLSVPAVRREVPAPGETGVQGTLWEAAA